MEVFCQVRVLTTFFRILPYVPYPVQYPVPVMWRAVASPPVHHENHCSIGNDDTQNELH